jgi:hypothetical protein
MVPSGGSLWPNTMIVFRAAACVWLPLAGVGNANAYRKQRFTRWCWFVRPHRYEYIHNGCQLAALKLTNLDHYAFGVECRASLAKWGQKFDERRRGKETWLPSSNKSAPSRSDRWLDWV